MNSFDKVSFSFGHRRILNALSFSVTAGECLALAGPNGSGKSTVLALAAGVLQPVSGKVSFSKEVAYIPQETALFEDMTALNNIRFFANVKKVPVPDTFPLRIEPYLDWRVKELSGGAKKRVSITCGLLGDVPVILLDEPCAALDLPAKEELLTLVAQLKESGHCVLYVGHETTELEQVYDKLLLLGHERHELFSRENLTQGLDTCLRDWFLAEPEDEIPVSRKKGFLKFGHISKQ